MEKFKIEELRKMIFEKRFHELKMNLEKSNVVDIAAFIEQLEQIQIKNIFRILSENIALKVFAKLNLSKQQLIVSALSEHEIKIIFNELFIDDAVDFFKKVPKMQANRILKDLKTEKRDQIKRYMTYPERSVGSMMSAEYIELKKNMIVKDVFNFIRKAGIDNNSIYTCYVTDDDHKVEGIVSVKNMILSEDETSIENLMQSNFIFTTPLENKENAIKLIYKYELLSIPVIDSDNYLQGVITVDDVMNKKVKQQNILTCWL